MGRQCERRSLGIHSLTQKSTANHFWSLFISYEKVIEKEIHAIVFHSFPHLLYICSWKGWAFDKMDFCSVPKKPWIPAHDSSSLWIDALPSIQPLPRNNLQTQASLPPAAPAAVPSSSSLTFLHWLCIYMPSLLSPSRFYDLVRFTHRTRKKKKKSLEYKI